MDRKKRILIIIPKLMGGGAERVLINLLNQIDYTRYEIDLFIGVKGGILEKDIPKSVNVRFLFPHRFIEILSSVLIRYWGITVLFKIFGRKISCNYDVGISYLESYYSNFLFHNKGSINKRVIFIHSSPKTYSNKFKKYRGESFRRLKKRFENIDTIVSVSTEALVEFRELYGTYSDMRVIYNSMNIFDILKKSKKHGDIKLDDKQINIIAVGSHIPVKGYEKLILACDILKNENIPFNLKVLGEGKLKQIHQELIKTLDLTKYITLLGFVENPYILLNNSDIFVMTSVAEGLPTSLCEAIILGKPVIVTNVPGCREVIENGKYGLLVDNTVPAIAEGLKLLILDKDQRHYYEQMAKERAKIFDDEITVKKYYDIFNL